MENRLPPLPPRKPQTTIAPSLPPKVAKVNIANNEKPIEKVIVSSVQDDKKVESTSIKDVSVDKKIAKEKQSKKELKTKNKDEVNNIIDETINSEKKSKKKKRIIITSIIAGSVIVIGAIVWILLGLFGGVSKLETPVVRVVSLSNQTVIMVDEQTNAVSYEFYIENVSSSVVKMKATKDNQISIITYLSNPGQYRIWAKCVSRNSSSSSDMSEKIIYTYKKELKTPVVEKQDNTLTWSPILNADFYKVYYTSEDNTQLNYETVNADSLNNLTFDLTTLEAGNYKLFVVADVNAGRYYKTSGVSNEFTYTKTMTLSAPTNVEFSNDTKIVSFDVDTDTCPTMSFLININNSTIKQTFVASELKSTYEFDLTPYLIDVEISAITVQAVGNLNYILDSEATSGSAVR